MHSFKEQGTPTRTNMIAIPLEEKATAKEPPPLLHIVYIALLRFVY